MRYEKRSQNHLMLLMCFFFKLHTCSITKNDRHVDGFKLRQVLMTIARKSSRMCETVGWRWIMTRNWHYGDLKKVDVVGDGR